MNKITVISDNDSDIRVIKDLLRVYYPKIKDVEDSGDINNSFLISVEEIRRENMKVERDIIIKIDGKDVEQEVEISFIVNGRKYKQVETLEKERFNEEKSNRGRRLLRLAVHKNIGKILNVVPSPWGILTGVRPTKIVHRLLDEGFQEEKIAKHMTRDFGMSPNRAKLLTRVAVFQHPLLLKQEKTKKLMSIYIGIPFCPTRCHYCSFPSFSLEKQGNMLEDYLCNLHREIKEVGQYLLGTGIKIQSVYVGGGTPTVLSSFQLDELLSLVEKNFSFSCKKELTVEGGRPDTISYEKLLVLKEHQVDRLSINPQTMREETLVAIGRKHTVKEVYNAYEMARKVGFPVINMDLIIGLPGENCAIVKQSLKDILRFKPENITLHALAKKRAAYYCQEKISLPFSDEGLAMLDLAHEILPNEGYIPYYLYRQKEIFAHGENVGYALTGKECLYNIQMIEERQTVLGFGVGSGSKFVNREDMTLENVYNPKDLIFYRDRIEEIIKKKVDKLQTVI